LQTQCGRRDALLEVKGPALEVAQFRRAVAPWVGAGKGAKCTSQLAGLVWDSPPVGAKNWSWMEWGSGW